MKKLLLILFLTVSYQSTTQAQVDIQLNPVAILFEVVQLSIEVPVGPNGGAELDIIGGDGEFGLIGIGKYYMRPEYGADRFYIGAFAGALFGTSAGGGFISGYKWMSNQGLSFELSLGIGRATSDIEVFPYGKVTVGYRFGQKE